MAVQWVKSLPAMPASQPESQLLCSLLMHLGRRREMLQALGPGTHMEFLAPGFGHCSRLGNK